MIKAEPLAEELGGEAAGLGVGEHALDLTLHQLRDCSTPGSGGAAEFFVGNGGPEEEAHAAGHIPTAERFGGHGFRRLFDAVEECGRYQDAGQAARGWLCRDRPRRSWRGRRKSAGPAFPFGQGWRQAMAAKRRQSVR